MSNDEIINGAVTVLRIITLAMVAGVVTFGIFVYFSQIAIQQPPEVDGAQGANAEHAEKLPLLSYVAAGATFVAFVMHFVIPGIVGQQGLKTVDGDLKRQVGVYQTKTLVALAILEGAAFLNIVAFMQEHQLWSLALVAGLVFWMLARFPNRGMIENWIEPQQF